MTEMSNFENQMQIEILLSRHNVITKNICQISEIFLRKVL